MPKRMIGQRTTIYLLAPDATAVADFTAATPKVSLAKLAADLAGTPKAWDISPAVVSGYTLNPTASDRPQSTSVADEGNAEQKGLGNYEGDFQFFRDDTAVATTVFNIVYNFFVDSVNGGSDKQCYILRRLGVPRSTPLAIGQMIEVYKFNSELHTRVVDDNKGEPILLHVPLGQQGLYLPYTAVTA